MTRRAKKKTELAVELRPRAAPIPFDDALRRILSAPPQPRKAKPKKKPKEAGK